MIKQLLSWLLRKIAARDEMEELAENDPTLLIAQNKLPELTRLLDQGLDVNVNTGLGQTPLHRCCLEGNLAIATFLIERGADPNVRNERGDTPLHLAAATILSPLQMRAMGEFLSTGRISEATKADAEAAPEEVSTPESINDALVRLLLAHGAKATGRGFRGLTPLHRAASDGLPGVARQLLSAGAGSAINEQDDEGRTALHHAVRWNTADITSLLLEKGADPNVQAKNGNTPLHDAAASGRIENVRLLVSHKADARTRNAGGKTPLEVAQEARAGVPGISEVVSVLSQV